MAGIPPDVNRGRQNERPDRDTPLRVVARWGWPGYRSAPLTPEEDASLRAAYAALAPEGALREVVGGARDAEVDGRCRRTATRRVNDEFDHPQLLMSRVP